MSVKEQSPARMKELYELGKIFGFKIPIDGHLSLVTRKIEVDIVRLDDMLAENDSEYDNANCTYKGVPNVSIKVYVQLKYGVVVRNRLEALL